MGKPQIWAMGLGLMAIAAGRAPVWAQDLSVVYPPDQHQTTADRIFIIGTADPSQAVLLNGQAIAPRSPSGHFAPSLPLAVGENRITLTQAGETLTLQITRLEDPPGLPAGAVFAPDSLLPAVDLARQPNELICLGATAAAGAQVSASLAGQSVVLAPQSAIALPPNAAVLTNQNLPSSPASGSPSRYEACILPPQAGDLGAPTYRFSLNGQTQNLAAPGRIQILPATPFQVATVTAAAGTARTGPSTDYSRITPLPQGTRAVVTGREGDWLRLDYGGWIRASETAVSVSTVPPRSLIRSVTSRQIDGWTEVLFPLQVPVPISLNQTADNLTLTLYNTTAQTDTIYFSNDPVVERLDWRARLPDQAEYSFSFRTAQQWGYKLRYEGSTLVLSLRHAPPINPRANRAQPLQGATILLDPGHGGPDDLGARGPTGYPEKAVALGVTELLRDRLEARGARVILTREGDQDIGPNQRAAQILHDEPDLALSLHYNALPDSGDALNTAGVGTFWYHAQSHDLAVFLHNSLVEQLNRPSYGVFWNNLALTRPHVAPAVLLELGFMINPYEFEWIVDPAAQQQLADALAASIETWLLQAR